VETENMKLLLVSATGSPYFEHCKEELQTFLKSTKNVGFVSAANLFDEVEYYNLMRERLTSSRMVRNLVHLRCDPEGLDTIKRIDSVIVGGGNTYALLKRMKESGMLQRLEKSVLGGMRYVGSSAGANVSGPNILTTNDWNVVSLTDFRSFGFVPFNINPHYAGQGASDAPHSETRDQRIREFHQVWSNPVVAVEETTVLKIEDKRISIRGSGTAKVFLRNREPRLLSVKEQLNFDDLGQPE
jgi:dipeptidase E